MLKIGGGWSKIAKESKKEYISVGIAKELLKRGFTLTEDDFLTLHLNENKTEDRHPDYILCLSNNEEN
jgi:uncharacterized protein (DUF736 family)